MATTKTVKTQGNPDLYVEEFLFRGRRKEDDRPTGWHVILGLEGTDPLGRPHPLLGTMNEAQAIERGWDIPEIIADVNGQTLADLEASRTEVGNLRSSLEASRAKVDALEASLGRSQNEMNSASETIAGLQNRIDELSANAEGEAKPT